MILRALPPSKIHMGVRVSVSPSENCRKLLKSITKMSEMSCKTK